jgi:hypothetical protein
MNTDQKEQALSLSVFIYGFHFHGFRASLLDLNDSSIMHWLSAALAVSGQRGFCSSTGAV